MGTKVPVCAVAAGASIIEKHLTLDRSMQGPDHMASLEPKEFAEMVELIREAEIILGSIEKKPTESELIARKLVRKSIVAVINIPKGTAIKPAMVAIKRPGTGMSPVKLNHIIGKIAAKDIPVDSLILEGDVIQAEVAGDER